MSSHNEYELAKEIIHVSFSNTFTLNYYLPPLYLLKVKLETICYRKCTDCHLANIFSAFSSCSMTTLTVRQHVSAYTEQQKKNQAQKNYR